MATTLTPVPEETESITTCHNMISIRYDTVSLIPLLHPRELMIRDVVGRDMEPAPQLIAHPHDRSYPFENHRGTQ